MWQHRRRTKPEARHFFAFPEDASWNADRQTVEFGVSIGEYERVVRVSRQVFRHFVEGAATPERCLATYHLERTQVSQKRTAEEYGAHCEKVYRSRDEQG